MRDQASSKKLSRQLLPDLPVGQDHFVWASQQLQGRTWWHADPSHSDPVHMTHTQFLKTPRQLINNAYNARAFINQTLTLRRHCRPNAFSKPDSRISKEHKLSASASKLALYKSCNNNNHVRGFVNKREAGRRHSYLYKNRANLLCQMVKYL